MQAVLNHVISGVGGVYLHGDLDDEWRDYAYRCGISTSGQPRAQQVAFERAVRQLQAVRAIGIWEPHVWIA